MRKKRSEEIVRRAEDALDLSRGLLANTPLITLHGASLCEIDNFKALLDFSAGSLRVNTAGGIVSLRFRA
ncbi:MAG: YabP/YqfC family sporulation protein [Clostridia bacterium]|nr:YabP/YqfC family sporulation protein [Clostridia bacterium]